MKPLLQPQLTPEQEKQLLLQRIKELEEFILLERKYTYTH